MVVKNPGSLQSVPDLPRDMVVPPPSRLKNQKADCSVEMAATRLHPNGCVLVDVPPFPMKMFGNRPKTVGSPKQKNVCSDEPAA